MVIGIPDRSLVSCTGCFLWLVVCIGGCAWLGYSLGGVLGALAGALVGSPLAVLGWFLPIVIHYGIQRSRSTDHWLRSIEAGRVGQYWAALSLLKERGEPIDKHEARIAEGLRSGSRRERRQCAKLLEEFYYRGHELREAGYDPLEPTDVCIDKAQLVLAALARRKKELDRVDEHTAIATASAKVRESFLRDTDRSFSICPVFRETRFIATEGGNGLSIPGGTSLPGALNIVPWDSYNAQVRFEEPWYYRVRFDFEFEEREYRYEGEIFLHELLFDHGEEVREEWLDFEDQIGETQWVCDYRKEMSYRLPDGSIRTFFVKYMDTYYATMFEPERMVVRCRHHDASDIPGYRVVYLTREWSRLLFQPASKIFYDSDGRAADVNPHAEDFVRVTRL